MAKIMSSIALATMLASVLGLAGCCTTGPSEYTEYVWEHRTADFIVDNPNLTASEKENELYLLGAAREMEPSEIEQYIEGIEGLSDDAEGDAEGQGGSNEGR